MRTEPKLSRRCAAGLTSALLVISPFVVGLLQPGSASPGILATYVNLVVVNVLVQDKNSGKPIEDLHAQDFEVFDNGKPVRLSVFHFGPESSGDSLTLWLVAQCAESNAIANLTEQVERTLRQLNSKDRVGIAHWCGNQDDSGIDLNATEDRAAAAAALRAAMEHKSEKAHTSGIAGIRETLSLIHRQKSDAHSPTRQFVVFLGSNKAGLPREEISPFAREVVSRTSLTVYAIRERVPHPSSLASLCEETGGQELVIDESNWTNALRQIVDGLRERYMIAFFPGALDGEWHTLRIRLTDEAIRKRGPVLLRYRSGYSSKGKPLRYSITEVASGSADSSDSLLSQALESKTGASEIPLAATGAVYEGASRRAKLTLELPDDEALSWKPSPDGSHHSHVTIVTAFLSSQGEMIEQKIQAYEIVRRPADSWTVLNLQIVIDNYLEYPANADRIRFVIRDGRGRIGIQDLPMKVILNAPKLPNVIA